PTRGILTFWGWGVSGAASFDTAAVRPTQDDDRKWAASSPTFVMLSSLRSRRIEACIDGGSARPAHLAQVVLAGVGDEDDVGGAAPFGRVPGQDLTGPEG